MSQIDGERVREILARHGAALALYARQWCTSPDDAVQEALLELIGLGELPPNPGAWLFRAVRWRALNLVRAEKRLADHQRRLADNSQSWFVETEGAEIEACEAEEMLASLDELDREIVVARVWGDLTFEQIAELVGSSTSSVHRRYSQALQRLAAMIQGEITTGESI